MFESLRIIFFGSQPVAKVNDKIIERLIQREFGNNVNDIKQKLNRIKSDSHNGKNRISAAIIKLANKDINLIDHFVELSNSDFRDVISRAEYPRCNKLGFENEGRNMKRIFLEDWVEYSNWIRKKE